MPEIILFGEINDPVAGRLWVKIIRNKYKKHWKEVWGDDGGGKIQVAGGRSTSGGGGGGVVVDGIRSGCKRPPRLF